MKKKSKSINYVNGEILKEYQWDDPHHHADIIPDLQKKLSLVNTNKLNHLDLGCGNGFTTKKIFHNFKTSLGVDISKNGIKLANKNFKSKKLSFSWMAAEDLYKKKKNLILLLVWK
jgi:predicted TPR repeat methyltransferase